MLRVVGAIALMLALAGCATQYGEASIFGGYADKVFDHNTGLVVAVGNGFTPPERVESMLMMRAAEITLKGGHQRFSLVSMDDDKVAAEAVRTGKAPSNVRALEARPNGPKFIGVRHTALYNGVPTATFNKMGGWAFVLMYKSGPGGTYDAKAMVAQHGPKLAEQKNPGTDEKPPVQR